MIYQKIKDYFNRKEPLNYPIPFALIDYTEIAKLNNIKDDQNKIITHRYLNKFGNVKKKQYKYNEAKVSILEKNGVPVYDKTKLDQRFDVLFTTDTNEIVYTK